MVIVMKTRNTMLAVARALVLVFLAGLSPLAAAWLVPECGFAVDLPGGAEPQKLTMPANDITILYTVQDGKWTYAMSCARQAKPPADAVAALEAAQGKLKGKVKSSRKLTVNGKPGRDVELVTATGAISRYRLIYVGATLYTITVTVPAGDAMSGKTAVFIESFKLTAG